MFLLTIHSGDMFVCVYVCSHTHLFSRNKLLSVSGSISPYENHAAIGPRFHYYSLVWC